MLPPLPATADVPAACGDSELRGACLKSCAVACEDPGFLQENVGYCLDNALVGRTPDMAPLTDAPHCAAHFDTAAAEPDAAESDAADIPEETDCSTLDRLSERRKCELAKVAPACSSTVSQLVGEAQLLVRVIDDEVSQYGDLLTRDWTDVTNQELLCSFTIDELDENYVIATENPAKLLSMKSRATDIQACQTEWEVFVRDNAATTGSDRLVDQVTRDAEDRLDALQGQIETISTSVATLENAAEIIVGIVDLHIIYCNPDGPTPPD
ncbi:MAG: hypothetical protein ACU0AY_14965 [Marinibacterium profundimaris]|uniref:Uncharacterized protein n=1 Tax=Marinibacterium profundimaris TaxID=1679460 RepID=A0A225NR59_9RHOB|nr:hypothetical protein ATO3_01025 [Marinibacterium profundimaris]